MAYDLTKQAFELLLNRLDPDPSVAAEKYETLRAKLEKAFLWRGCIQTEADKLADVVLDRVARKLEAGEEIQSLNAYAGEVLRFVWLEHLRSRKEDAVGDDLPEVEVQPDISGLDEPDSRMRCLRKCMAETVSDDRDRQLIVGYYDSDAGEKAKEARKKLAGHLGISMTLLKVKACRIRERLEKCINHCMAKLTVTKPALRDTNTMEGS